MVSKHFILIFERNHQKLKYLTFIILKLYFALKIELLSLRGSVGVDALACPDSFD